MVEDYKKRLWTVIKPILEIGVVGICYYIFVLLTGFKIPCLIYLISRKYCPGCGITRMCLAMLRLDFHAAFHANPLLFILLPLMVVYGIWKGGYYVITGKQSNTKAEQIAVVIVFVVTIIFWIMRNMEAYSFLAPKAL